MSASIRQRLYDLKAQREGYVQAAEKALEADNQEEYRANMDKAKGLNERLDELQADLTEAERYDSLTVPGQPGQTGAQGTQGAQGGAFKTVDDLKGMTPEEINRQWAALLARTE